MIEVILLLVAIALLVEAGAWHLTFIFTRRRATEVPLLYIPLRAAWRAYRNWKSHD